MKKTLFLFFFLITHQVYAVVNPLKNTASKQEMTISEFTNYSNAELEQKWNIDLNWKEKASLWLLKRKLKKAIKKNKDLGNQKIQQPNDSNEKFDPLSIIASSLLLTSVAGGLLFINIGGFFIGGLGVLATIIIAVISLIKQYKKPKKYKGSSKGLALITLLRSLAALFLGGTWVIALLSFPL